MTIYRAAGLVLVLVALAVLAWVGGGMLYAAIPGNAPHALSTALP